MRRPILAFVAALVLAPIHGARAQAVSGDIGLRLLVQPWDSATDDDAVRRLDRPGLISGSLAEAWRQAKPGVAEAIIARLGTPDIAPGFTLRDIVLALPDPWVTMQRVSGGGRQPLLMRLDLRIAGAEVEATSTTPSPLGSFADPRCRARLDLGFSLSLSAGQGAGALMQAGPLPGEPPVRVEGFDWSGENAVCSAFRAAVAAFGFEARVRQMVAEGVASSPAAATLLSALQGALGAANAQVAGVVPPQLVRQQAWLTGPQGAQLLSLYFGPDVPLADPAPRATIGGVLRILPLRGIARTEGDPGVDCNRLPLAAERKTGPRPVINPAGELGVAPTEPLPLSTGCSTAPDGSLVHRVSGLSAAFPTLLLATGMSHGCPQGQAWKTGLVLTFPNRAEQWVRPVELSGRFDIDVTPMSAPCALEYVEQRDPRDRLPIDRGLAWRTFEEIARGRMTLDAPALDVLGRFGPVALNPQPLPPEPPDRARALEEVIRLQQDQIQLQQRQLRLQQEMMRLRPGG